MEPSSTMEAAKQTQPSNVQLCDPSSWPPQLAASKHGYISVVTFNTLRRNFTFEWANWVNKKYRSWEHRHGIVLDLIDSLEADILCLQEVELRSLEDDYAKRLVKLGYAYVHAKWKGKKDCDFTKPLIFYKTDRFNLVHQDPRSRTVIAELVLKTTGQRIMVASAHLQAGGDDKMGQRFSQALKTLKCMDQRWKKLNPRKKKSDKRSKSRSKSKEISRSPSPAGRHHVNSSHRPPRLGRGDRASSPDRPPMLGREPSSLMRAREFTAFEKMHGANKEQRNEGGGKKELLKKEAKKELRKLDEGDGKEKGPRALCLVCGDMNASFNEPFYALLTNGGMTKDMWEKGFGPQPRKFEFKSEHVGKLHDAHASVTETSKLDRPFTWVADTDLERPGMEDFALDFIFHSAGSDGLTLKALRMPYDSKSREKMLKEGIPNSEHGSDHLPVAAIFELPPAPLPKNVPVRDEGKEKPAERRGRSREPRD